MINISIEPTQQRIQNSIWYLLIALISFSLPLSPRINVFFIALLFIYWLVIIVKHLNVRHVELMLPPFYLLFCFYFWGVISLAYTEPHNVLKAFHEFVENRLSLVLLPVIILTNPKNNTFIVAFYSFVLGLFLLCLSLNIEVLFKIQEQGEPLIFFFKKYVRTQMLEGAAFAIHSMYLSMMLLIAIIFNCYFLLYTDLKHNFILNFLLTLISVYFLVMIYLTGAKMSIVSIGFLAFLYLSYFLIKKAQLGITRRFFLSLLFTSVFFLLGLNYKSTIALELEKHFNIEQLAYESLPRRIHKYLKEGDKARGISWQSAIDVIKENFWFGVGAGDSLEEMQKKRPVRSWSYEVGANAHNQYLDTAVQLGVVGLFFWLVFYFWLIHHGLQQRNPLLVIFLLIVGIALITESMLQEHRGLVFISFFAPLLAACKPDTYSR